MPYARFINNVRGTSQFESRDEKRERKQSQTGERKKDEAELRGKAESKKETTPDPKKSVSVEDEIKVRKERDEMKRAAEGNLIMYVTQIYESEEFEADARLYMQQSGMYEADIERLLVDIRRIWRQNAAR